MPIPKSGSVSALRLSDEWETKIRPLLRKVPLFRLMKLSGKSRRTLIYARAWRTRPHRKNQELLASIVRKLALI